jgi:hypothetical protein
MRGIVGGYIVIASAGSWREGGHETWHGIWSLLEPQASGETCLVDRGADSRRFDDRQPAVEAGRALGLAAASLRAAARHTPTGAFTMVEGPSLIVA